MERFSGQKETEGTAARVSLTGRATPTRTGQTRFLFSLGSLWILIARKLWERVENAVVHGLAGLGNGDCGFCEFTTVHFQRRSE